MELQDGPSGEDGGVHNTGPTPSTSLREGALDTQPSEDSSESSEESTAGAGKPDRRRLYYDLKEVYRALQTLRDNNSEFFAEANQRRSRLQPPAEFPQQLPSMPPMSELVAGLNLHNTADTMFPRGEGVYRRDEPVYPEQARVSYELLRVLTSEGESGIDARDLLRQNMAGITRPLPGCSQSHLVFLRPGEERQHTCVSCGGLLEVYQVPVDSLVQTPPRSLPVSGSRLEVRQVPVESYVQPPPRSLPVSGSRLEVRQVPVESYVQPPPRSLPVSGSRLDMSQVPVESYVQTQPISSPVSGSRLEVRQVPVESYVKTPPRSLPVSESRLEVSQVPVERRVQKALGSLPVRIFVYDTNEEFLHTFSKLWGESNHYQSLVSVEVVPFEKYRAHIYELVEKFDIDAIVSPTDSHGFFDGKFGWEVAGFYESLLSEHVGSRDLGNWRNRDHWQEKQDRRNHARSIVIGAISHNTLLGKAQVADIAAVSPELKRLTVPQLIYIPQKRLGPSDVVSPMVIFNCMWTALRAVFNNNGDASLKPLNRILLPNMGTYVKASPPSVTAKQMVAALSLFMQCNDLSGSSKMSAALDAIISSTAS